MTKATGAQAGVAYIAETVLGTTPATPALVEILHTGFTPDIQKDGAASADLAKNRMIYDFRHGFRTANFGLNFTLKHGEFDAFLEAALFGAFTANVLKAGTTRKSLSIETEYADVGQFYIYRGCMVNTLSLALSAENPEVTGSFGFLGMTVANAQSSVDGDGWTAAGSKRAFDNFTGSINEGGSSIGIVTGLELSLANGLNPAKVLFNKDAVDIFHGRSNLTGTLSAHFEDETLVDKFLNETPTSVDFTLTDPDSNTLTFDIPAVRLTGGSPPSVDGEGGLTVSLPFQAVYDAVDDTSLVITRSA